VLGYLARRLVNYVVLTLVATFLAFALASVTFDPLGLLRQRQPPPPAATIAAKGQELHLDQAVPQRFLTWMGGVLHGDFGRTTQDRPITAELGRRAGVSLRLFLVGITVGILLGVLLGVVGAIRQYKLSDYLATLYSFVVLSTPVFVLGTLLKYGALEVNQLTGSQYLQFTNEAADIDQPTQTLTFGLSNAPAGASIDTSSDEHMTFFKASFDDADAMHGGMTDAAWTGSAEWRPRSHGNPLSRSGWRCCTISTAAVLPPWTARRSARSGTRPRLLAATRPSSRRGNGTSRTAASPTAIAARAGTAAISGSAPDRVPVLLAPRTPRSRRR